MAREKSKRLAVNLETFPDLVVIYLGIRAVKLKGIPTILSLGPKIDRAVNEKPDGLLRHENIIYSLFPLHVGMRQYWRDYNALERWTRSLPHKQWWTNFMADTGGAELWHETYFLKGGMEGIISGLSKPVGFWAFAPYESAKGSAFSARNRAKVGGSETGAAPVSESDFY